MVSWSANVNKGASYAARAAELPGVEVTFVGRWPSELTPGKVRVLPPQTHQDLPDLIRQHHAILHMAFNEPCSNANSRRHGQRAAGDLSPQRRLAEIVGNAGVPGEPDLQSAVEQVQDRYAELRDKVLAQRPALSIATIAAAYRQVFEALGPQPL